MGWLAASRRIQMLSAIKLSTIHDHFRSETAAPAIFAAVTALAGYKRRELMGWLAVSRQSLMLSMCANYQNIKILSKYQQLISTDKTKTTFKNETKATFKTNTECWVESLWLYKAHSPVQYKGAPTVQSSVPVQQCSQIPDYNQCFSLHSLISRTQLNIIRSHCTMYSQVHSKTT